MSFLLSCLFLLSICVIAYNFLTATKLTLEKTHQGVQVIVKRKLLGILTTKTEVVDDVTHFSYNALKSDDSIMYDLVMHTKSENTHLTNVSFQSQNKRLLKKLNDFVQQNHPVNTRRHFRLDYDSLIFHTMFIAPFFLGILTWFLYTLFSLTVAEENKVYVQNLLTDKLYQITGLADKSTVPDYFPKDVFWAEFCHISKSQKQHVVDGIQENKGFGTSDLSLKDIKKQMQYANQGGWRVVNVLDQDDALVVFYEKNQQELSYTFVQNGGDVNCQISLKRPAEE